MGVEFLSQTLIVTTHGYPFFSCADCNGPLSARFGDVCGQQRGCNTRRDEILARRGG